jgi:hypothetical protein
MDWIHDEDGLRFQVGLSFSPFKITMLSYVDFNGEMNFICKIALINDK